MEDVEGVTCSVGEISIEDDISNAVHAADLNIETSAIRYDVTSQYDGAESDRLPLVSCEPVELYVTDRLDNESTAVSTRLTAAAAADDSSSFTDEMIGVIAVGSNSAIDELPGCRLITPAFDDFIDPRWQPEATPCYVIPTFGGIAVMTTSTDPLSQEREIDMNLQTFSRSTKAAAPTNVDDVTKSAYRFDQHQQPKRSKHRRAADYDYAEFDDVTKKASQRIYSSANGQKEADTRELTAVKKLYRRHMRQAWEEQQVANNEKRWQLVHSQGTESSDENHAEIATGITRRLFHGGGHFVRYRYPTKFHKEPSMTGKNNHTAVSTPTKGQLTEFLPASLRTATRYGKEPHLQSPGLPLATKRRHQLSGGSSTGNGTDTNATVGRGSAGKNTAAVVVNYLPLCFDAETQCCIEKPPPARPEMIDAGTQTVENSVKYTDDVVQTDPVLPPPKPTTVDIGILAIAETCNKLVETSARLVDFPEIDFRQ